MALVNKIKVNPAYSDADGKTMGILGTLIPPPDLSTLTPVLTLGKAAGGQPDLKWSKQGMPQLLIQVDRGDGKGWVDLVTSDQSHYVDPHPLPTGTASALWQYQAIHKDHDQLAGQWSAVVTVAVGGNR